MEENKSGLYIVAIVGLIAVVALVVLVTSGRDRAALSATSASEDVAGQAARVAASKPVNDRNVYLTKTDMLTMLNGCKMYSQSFSSNAMWDTCDAVCATKGPSAPTCIFGFSVVQLSNTTVSHIIPCNLAVRQVSGNLDCVCC